LGGGRAGRGPHGPNLDGFGWVGGSGRDG
jgi:hypothetical protein